MSGWQAIVGLSMLFLPCCCFFGLCFVDECCCQSGKSSEEPETQQAQTPPTRESVGSVSVAERRQWLSFVTQMEGGWIMWESASLYLVIYSAVKHSPVVAATFGIGFTCLRSALATLVWDGGPAAKKEKCLIPVSVYTNLQVKNFIQCGGVFAIQVALYMMLLLWVFEQEPLRSEDDTKVMFYIVGAFIGTVIRIHHGAFHSVEWAPFWHHYFNGGFRDKGHYPFLRLFLSWLVNELFAQTTILMLPVILTESSDRVEFVKDATAVLFISELDKLENIKEEQHVDVCNTV